MTQEETEQTAGDIPMAEPCPHPEEELENHTRFGMTEKLYRCCACGAWLNAPFDEED